MKLKLTAKTERILYVAAAGLAVLLITVLLILLRSSSAPQDVPEPTELSFTGRTGTHTENANLICFLASDEASYISGQNYQVDGCRKKM